MSQLHKGSTSFTRFDEYFKKFKLGGPQVSTNPRKRPTTMTDLRGKYTGNNSKRPLLRELIEEHDKITNNLSKKLVANDKILEDINVKMDIFLKF
jgi:hypothetical protein